MTVLLGVLAIALVQTVAVPGAGPAAITGDSAVSIALLMAMIGGVAGITWRLATITTKLDALATMPDRLTRLEETVRPLGNVPERMSALERHIETLETDISNLWSAYRRDPPDKVRRERGPRLTRTEPEE